MKTFEPSCMKTIGLIGGMSWESSKLYYEAINHHTKRLLGGNHSARCVMVSVDFADIERLTFQRRWDCIGDRMARSAMQLQHAGADVVVLCTNTIHRVSHAISRSIDIPFLHIAQTTAEAIKAQGLNKVALLGTRFTMEEDFYTSVLAIQHGLDVIIPPMYERQEVHDIIYKELVKGKFTLKARQKVQHIM
ncbi:MAG: amino acid racemase, partial [Bacteroidota bacterium]